MRNGAAAGTQAWKCSGYTSDLLLVLEVRRPTQARSLTDSDARIVKLSKRDRKDCVYALEEKRLLGLDTAERGG